MGFPQGVHGWRPPEDLPSPPPIGWSIGFIATPLAKLVRSAVANAEDKNTKQKAGIDVDNLYVSHVSVDEGPSQWRIRPRAQGRAFWIQKRTSHVTVVLEER